MERANAGWLASMRALLQPPQLNAEERAAYAAEVGRRVIERSRFGAPIGIAIALGLAFWASGVTNPAVRSVGVAICIAATCVFGLYLPLSSLRVFRKRPNWLVFPVSLVLASGVAGVASTADEGDGGMAVALLLVIWVYLSVLAPLPPKAFLIDVVAQLAVVSGGLWLGGQIGRMPSIYIVLTLGGAGFALLGVVVRENADRRSFVLHRRLDDAHRVVAEQRAEVQRMNARLEQRVEAQVQEIVEQTRDVEALNAQLQQRVRERSRELAAALEKLHETEESESAQRLEAGFVVGERAKVVRLLGVGGMGEVYLCDDLLTGKRVALKVVRGGGSVDEKALRRMLGEASAAASITHPGVVKTLHVDVSADGNLYLLTEYVSGETLSSRLGRGPLGAAQAARLGQILAGALSAAHANGVVHRDVKPHNVMLTPAAPGVKLLDFGISKTADEMFKTALTAQGQILGTPAYMAPEQFKNPTGVTSACDVYSLGLLVYEAAAGEGPFSFDNLLQAIAAHSFEDPPPLADRAPAVPKEMSDLVARCLAKDPQQRPTAAHVANVLGRICGEVGAPDATDLAAPVSAVTRTIATPGARKSVP